MPRTRNCMENVNVLRWRDNIRDRSGQLLDPPFPRRRHFFFFKIPKSQTVAPCMSVSLRGTPKSRLRGTPAFLERPLPKKVGGTPPHFALNEGSRVNPYSDTDF